MLKTSVVWVGGAALLAATVVDTVAVIGRHVGIPVTGSIELMQAIVLVSAGTGLVVATMTDAHARVRLLVDRLSSAKRLLADRMSDILTLSFVVLLLIGSVWIAADLWDGHEQSELLGVPWAPLRMIANACLFAVAVITALRILRGNRP